MSNQANFTRDLLRAAHRSAIQSEKRGNKMPVTWEAFSEVLGALGIDTPSTVSLWDDLMGGADLYDILHEALAMVDDEVDSEEDESDDVPEAVLG